MSSINQQVWKLISGDVSIQKGLKRDIINIRGLAKFFMKKYGVKASLDSVISAIRRYDGSETFTEEELTSVFKHCIISTKNNVLLHFFCLSNLCDNMMHLLFNLRIEFVIRCVIKNKITDKMRCHDGQSILFYTTGKDAVAKQSGIKRYICHLSKCLEFCIGRVFQRKL